MQSLEKDQLAKYTPCNFQKIAEVVKALAEVHIELVLIHPFREGNGRCSRILASIAKPENRVKKIHREQ